MDPIQVLYEQSIMATAHASELQWEADRYIEASDVLWKAYQELIEAQERVS